MRLPNASFRRRLGTAVAILTAAVLATASPANACYSQYDDGGAETTLDLDYTDDTARKVLTVPSTVLPLPPLTYLDVYATSYPCQANDTNELRVNGTVAATFNACLVWPGGPVWGRISFNPGLLHVGDNTFEIKDIDGTWTSGIYFGVDTSSSYGRSSMSANGSSQSGELMWRLQSPTVLC